MWFGGCGKKRTSHDHSTCAHTGRLDSSLLDKTAQENLKQKIDFGGSSMPSLFNTHAYQVVCKSDYIISLQDIISNQIVDLFLPFSSKTFSFFFLSCLVFCISCTIALTPPFHPILHSYPLHLIAARLRWTYMHISHGQGGSGIRMPDRG